MKNTSNTQDSGLCEGYKHIDLFTGIGGFTLAASWTGFTTRVMCECEPRCVEFLSRRWPGIPIVRDVREFDGARHTGATLLTAGVPCQPVSCAGKRRGSEDDRWLWPEALRVVSEARPAWVLFENPPGIGSMAEFGIQPPVDADGCAVGSGGDIFTRQGIGSLHTILDSLEKDGYEVAVLDIPACAVNSPQRRQRYWIIGCLADSEQNRQQAERQRSQRYDVFNPGATCGDLGHSASERGGKGGTESERFEWAPTVGESGGQSCMAVPIRELGGSGSFEPQRRTLTTRHAADDMADTEKPRSRAGLRESGAEHNGYGAPGSAWDSFVWVPCADGKFRRAPNDSFSVVDGLHRSVLAGLGNSIVPQIAAEIMNAIMGVIHATF